MLKQVEIFTDGSCLGNPGPGGYGAILRYRGREKTFSAGYTRTTNNRMELMAAIVALEALKEHCEVILSTDSQYVRQGITQWIHNWKKTWLENSRQKTSKKMSISGNVLMLHWGSIKSNGNGLKAMPDTRKTNVAMNWLVPQR